jgi:hypothetical protein
MGDTAGAATRVHAARPGNANSPAPPSVNPAKCRRERLKVSAVFIVVSPRHAMPFEH